MGRVCEKHNEFYETACRWCDGATGPVLRSDATPAHAGTYVPVAEWNSNTPVCDHSRSGLCVVCGYDILPVSPMYGPIAAKPPSVVRRETRDEITLVLQSILGPIEEIGPQETAWWREFYGGNQK